MLPPEQENAARQIAALNALQRFLVENRCSRDIIASYFVTERGAPGGEEEYEYVKLRPPPYRRPGRTR